MLIRVNSKYLPPYYIIFIEYGYFQFQMNQMLKKLIVVTPVVMLGIFYLNARQSDYNHTGGKRLLILATSLMILYGWIFLETMVRKQKSVFQVVTQSSFFVYV